MALNPFLYICSEFGEKSGLVLTSVCCYSELLQEPEKFKKSNPKE